MNISISAKKARLFGAVGSGLGIFLLLAPAYGGIINLLGSVLILASVWGLSILLKNRKIFFFFVMYVLLSVGMWLLSTVTAGYLIGASNGESLPTEAKILQIFLLLLPIIASYFLFKSYRKLGSEIDVQLFLITSIVHLSLTSLISLLNMILLFSPGRLIASLSLLLTFLSFLAIPILGTISYILIRPTVVSYRSRT